MSNTAAMTAFKDKARVTWATGRYNEIANYLPSASAHLVRAVGVAPGERVLDVACGTGVTAITARHAGATVTGLDLTPELLEHAREEAVLAGVPDVEWRQGDAEDLPFEDGAFDVTLSSFGHMFAPRPDVTISEMLRVTHPGGRIGFVTHPPDGVIGAIFRATAKHVSPPPDAPPSPMLWGDPETVRDRLGPHVRDLVFERGSVAWPMVSPAHMWRLFSTRYGPTMKALESFDGDAKKTEALARDFVDAVRPWWRDNVVAQAYLLTRAVRA